MKKTAADVLCIWSGAPGAAGVVAPHDGRTLQICTLNATAAHVSSVTNKIASCWKFPLIYHKFLVTNQFDILILYLVLFFVLFFMFYHWTRVSLDFYTLSCALYTQVKWWQEWALLPLVDPSHLLQQILPEKDVYSLVTAFLHQLSYWVWNKQWDTYICYILLLILLQSSMISKIPRSLWLAGTILITS